MTFRPALRPGAVLLRRDATHLQIGTSPGIVIADRPGLHDLLRLVDGARDIARLADEVPVLRDDLVEVLAGLRAAGVIFDASRWTAPGRRALDAEARHHDLSGRDPAGLDARRTLYLALHHDPGTRAVLDLTRGILSASGVTALDAADPTIMVVATTGEAPRGIFERAASRGLTHLPVVVDEDRVRIGPLVRPGRTPCLTCHDLHRADWDHAWSAMIPQLGRHIASMTPPAIPAALTHAAALELAVELLGVADGQPARTSGECLVVGPGPTDRTSWPVAFHHGCGCALLSAA